MEQLKETVFKLLQGGTWESLDRVIDILLENTGKGLILDPFENPDGLLWNSVGIYLILNKMHQEALTLYQVFLNCYYDLQEEHETRIHKGTPLQYLGIVNRHFGQLELARKYHILAFIEDVIRASSGASADSVLSSPASIVLRRTFRMRDTELLSLQNFVLEQSGIDEILYPEALLLKWIIINEREAEATIARSKEESLYKVNLNYLRKMWTRLEEDSTGKALELLATYLFSCVDGFEPVFRKRTKAFHFDVVIRNLVIDHPLLKSLGDYIGVECKDIEKTVTGQELNHFIQRLRLCNIKCGIIFTNKGISGIQYKKTRQYGKLIQVKAFNRDGLVVFDLTKSDLDKILKGDNLLTLLLRKYEDIRFT